ncbi:MAG: hypothetical protein WD801_15105 [Gemmatimonadaceae bacterium]
MSAGLATQLRARPTPIEIGAAGADTWTIRVQASDIWATVRVVAGSATPVAEVKQRVLSTLFPQERYADDFVLKLAGWEVLDEQASLADAGVVNGGILLLAYRRRRPVR